MDHMGVKPLFKFRLENEFWLGLGWKLSDQDGSLRPSVTEKFSWSTSPPLLQGKAFPNLRLSSYRFLLLGNWDKKFWLRKP